MTKILNLWPENHSSNKNPECPGPTIEIFEPEKKISRKAIIVCPGGGYSSIAEKEAAPVAEFFSKNGFTAIVLRYRVAPNRYPAPMDDAARAMRMVRSMADKLGIDPQQVGLMGFSAAGHLASTLATQPELFNSKDDDLAEVFDCRPDFLILGYPVISLVKYAHLRSGENLLGGNFALDMREKLSSERNVSGKTPPVFIFHCQNDQTVSVNNSIIYAQACITEGIPIELHIYPGGRHGITLGLDEPNLKSLSDLILKWLYKCY